MHHQFAAKQCRKIVQPMYDVFISYRKVDSARAFVPLLYDHLSSNGVRPFLDTINMKPDHIYKAIHSCKVGVVVLSPSYCDSLFCLHQLALLNESKKRVVPVFYDIKPSQIQVKGNACYPPQVLQRFMASLEETKYTVRVTFDSSYGYNSFSFLAVTLFYFIACNSLRSYIIFFSWLNIRLF